MGRKLTQWLWANFIIAGIVGVLVIMTVLNGATFSPLAFIGAFAPLSMVAGIVIMLSDGAAPRRDDVDGGEDE